MYCRFTPNQSQPLTTAQRLGSLVKSARDIMRKDKGLNGGKEKVSGPFSVFKTDRVA
jgi:type I restriction enzyme M protein